MKIKQDFVTNSSSTAFIIHNKTSVKKTMVDFVKENPQLIDQFLDEYSWYKGTPGYTQEGLLKSAAEYCDPDLYPGENYKVFGDEYGTIINNVFDYILRDGGSSKSFIWSFEESLR